MYTFEEIFFVVGIIWGPAACVLLAAAWVAIRRDKDRFERLHRRLLIVMTAGGWAFVCFYLFGYRLRKGPMNVSPAAVPWLATHGTIALITLLGATVLLWARLTARDGADHLALRARLNERHALYGTIVALLWLFTHISGILNLYLVGLD